MEQTAGGPEGSTRLGTVEPWHLPGLCRAQGPAAFSHQVKALPSCYLPWGQRSLELLQEKICIILINKEDVKKFPGLLQIYKEGKIKHHY